MNLYARLGAIVMLGTAGAAAAADLSTPKSALRSLEDAYTRKDIEAAVAARDFEYEAREMLVALKNLPNADAQLVRQAAEVLEASFRAHLKSAGFPSFAQLQCSVSETRNLRPDLVELTEQCIHPDGQRSRQTLHAAKSAVGWRIVTLPR